MRIKDFKGVRAGRNYLICERYVKGERVEDIAQNLLDTKVWSGTLAAKVNLCYKIIYKSRNLLKIDKEFEVLKDTLRIERDIPTRGYGKKDKVDLIKAKHEILNGNRALVDQSHHHTLQIINYGEVKSSDIPNTSRRLQAA